MKMRIVLTFLVALAMLAVGMPAKAQGTTAQTGVTQSAVTKPVRICGLQSRYVEDIDRDYRNAIGETYGLLTTTVDRKKCRVTSRKISVFRAPFGCWTSGRGLQTLRDGQVRAYIKRTCISGRSYYKYSPTS